MNWAGGNWMFNGAWSGVARLEELAGGFAEAVGRGEWGRDSIGG
jgi:hypothetical protein